MQPCDFKERQLAVDPLQSFVVQAPAGSGKTTILVERVLNCLLHVSKPNQVMVLTFTKKAANEVNLRISTLMNQNIDELSNSNLSSLILRVKEHAKKNKWHEYPTPYANICSTFDSLTYQLADIEEHVSIHPDYLYEKTVDTILYHAEYESVRTELVTIKKFINNKHERLRELFIHLLKCREQWLETLLDQSFDSNQAYLLYKKTTLNQLIHNYQDELCVLRQVWELTPQFNQSFNHESLVDWQAFARMFITSSGSWRTRLTTREGFTTDQKALKDAILCKLSLLPNSLAETLFDLQSAPSNLSKKIIEMTHALKSLMPKLCAMLNITMEETGLCDYIHVAIRCLDNISENEDTGMKCSTIYHLLVDEYQDTSNIQASLIKGILSHWDFSERRSLFIVGDPMQSIYKFRQADVREFIHAQNGGFNPIALKNIVLKTNFRSNETIIHHVNKQFSKIFPKSRTLFEAPFHLAHRLLFMIQKVLQDGFKLMNIRGLINGYLL